MVRKFNLTNRNLLILAVYAFIFTMPYGITFNSLSIVLIVLIWLCRLNMLQDIKNVLTHPPYKLLYLLYGIYILSVLNSTDTQAALSQLELKATLLIFPLVFSSIQLESAERLNFIKAFVASVTLATLISLLKMAYKIVVYGEFRDTVDPSNVDWVYFSYFLPKQLDFHPPYYSMYSTMAAIMVFYLLLLSFENNKRLKISIYWLLLLIYLLSFTVILSSRTALVSGLFILAAGGFAYLVYKKKTLIAVLFLALISLLSVSLIQSSPYLKRKLNNNYGVEQREQLWQASGNLISENSLFGVGSGDTKQELAEKLYHLGDSTAFEQQMDPHNQYIQVLLALGITGFVVFISYLVYMLYISLKQKNYLLTAFIILYMLCAITESTLETQKGMIFFIFLSTLLLSTESKINYVFFNERPSEKIIY